MSLYEPKTLYDGMTTLQRGVDSGRASALIGRDQVSFAINTTFRSGFAESRPGIREVTLSFLDQNNSVDTTVQTNFEDGRFQGASTYISPDGNTYLIASIGGRIFQIDPVLGNVQDLSTISGLTNPSNRPQAWMEQSEHFLIIQDGQSVPIIFDGAGLRRSVPRVSGGTEVPVGTVMEYNNGRLWVALPDGFTFVAGDLAYSVTGYASDVLGFTENTFLNGGGAFALPMSAGRITAMASVASQDSTLGQGPLQIFTSQGAASINAPFDRDVWQDTQSPIQTISLLSVGPRSAYATVNVNGDIWYRSNDGIRSFMFGRRDHGTWVNTPLSHEMDRILLKDDPYLLQNASAVRFDNRLLTTISPYRHTETDGTEHGVAWRGLAVLDFSPISSMFDRLQPAWEGIWTGLEILQILVADINGVERCFIFAINSSNQIELWELTRSERFDNIDNGIPWTVETRSFGFADLGETLKQLSRAELWFDRLEGTLTIDVDFRPDNYWSWLQLDSGSKCASSGQCSITCPGDPPNFPQPQYRPRILTSAPSATSCETGTNKPYRNGYEFQIRLTLTGAARLRRLRIAATSLPEDTATGCIGTQTCVSDTGCEDDPFSYSIAA